MTTNRMLEKSSVMLEEPSAILDLPSDAESWLDAAWNVSESPEDIDSLLDEDSWIGTQTWDERDPVEGLALRQHRHVH